MRVLAALVLTFWLGAAASAQTVTVRAGEHSDFSRFVMLLPEGSRWRVDQSRGRARLDLGIPEVRYDVAEVFRRIPRLRVEALDQASPGDALEFRLACDCRVESFVHNGRYLVIDVKDGPAPEDAPRQGLVLPVNGVPYRFDLGVPTGEDGTAAVETEAERPAEPAPLPDQSGPTALALPVVTRTYAGSDPGESPVQLPGAARIARVAELEQALNTDLARARGQGLLAGTDAGGQAAQNTEDRQEVDRKEPERAPPEPQPKPRDRSAHLTVTTAMDRDFAAMADALAVDQDGNSVQCIPNRRLAVQEWAVAAPASTQIGHWRGQLTGALDAVNTEAALALARVYLHFGFGAEASQVLDFLPPDTPDLPLLRSLANLVDGNTLKGGNPFRGQEQCDSDAVLWAVLASPDRIGTANEEAVLQAVARLPVDLRTHLGAQVGRLYAGAGREDPADAALRTVRRVVEDETPAPGLAMAEAAIADLKGNHDAADTHREEVMETNNDLSPTALVDLVDSRLRSGAPLPPDIPDLAEGYALQYETADLGPALRRATALSDALTGAFDAAFGRLGDLAELDGENAAADLRETLLTLLAERASDMDFLKHALDQTHGREDAFTDELSLALAGKLLGLGFPQQAIRLLAVSQAQPVPEGRRMLRAQAALAADLPHEALVATLGLDGAEPARLRGAALQMMREHAVAAETLAAADQPDAAARSAWLAG